jgi:hypothetical protein
MDGGTTHLQNIGGFIERHITALGALAFAINRNSVGVPKTPDMGSCPCGAVPRQLAGAIQDSGYCHIWQLSSQYPHQIDGHCQVSRGWRWDDGRERLTA